MTAVSSLIASLVAVFIGESNFALNSFTISSSEFGYGIAIIAAMAFLLAVATAYLLTLARSRRP